MLDPIKQFDIKSNIHRVSTHPFKFSDYRLVYFDNPNYKKPNGNIAGVNGFIDYKEWYIVGVYEIEEPAEQFDTLDEIFSTPVPDELEKLNEAEDCHVQYYDNLEVLMSLLNLGKLLYPTWDSFDQTNKDSQLLYSKEIIDWCKKFGLPSHSTYLQENYIASKRRNEESNCGFGIYLFKLKVIMLYNKFNIWYGLTNNDINLIRKHVPNDMRNNIFTKEEIKEYKELLPYSMATPILKLIYDKKTDAYKMVPFAYDIFTVAYFQLSMLIMNKYDNNLRYCDKCGDLFVIKHRSTKYCDICKSFQNSNDVRNLRKNLENEAKEYIVKKYKNGNNTPDEIFVLEEEYIKNSIGKSTPFNKKKIKVWINKEE